MKKVLLTAAALCALALPAIAADMAPAPRPVYKAPIPVPVCIWCGFYLGLNAGGTWSDNNSVAVNSALTQDFVPGPASYGAASAAGASGNVPVGGRSGFIGGGQVGYNWQVAPAWLAGFETDIQGITGNGNGTVTNAVGPFAFGGAPEVVTTSIASSSHLDYLGTVRGRLGYLFTPTFLLYGTGGLAYGGVKASTAINQSNNDCVFFPATCIQGSTSSAGSLSQTRAGWTAGAGLEWMFASKWSAKAEYLHYDLGSVTFANGALVTSSGTIPAAGGPSVVSTTSTAKFSGDIVRAGVNFHWN
jgi:outer membrane immunogenic protein